MTHAQLTAAIAAQTGLTKADAGRALAALTAIVTAELRGKGTVKIAGLGNFKAKHRAARTANNPQTGGTIKVPARWVPAFSISKTLKDSI